MTALATDARSLLGFFERLPGPLSTAWLMLGLVLGWWLYVPIHELLHVAGCVLAGGSVSRLEIDAIYGGALLAEVFPFVVSGSEYAGRLTGFDTGGSDLVYQACVLMPYLLTIFPGFWLWQKALARERPGPGSMLAAGGLLPLVAAPMISLTGDYYESASIVVSRLFAGSAGRPLEAWRSDDVFRMIGDWTAAWTVADVAAIAGGLVLALVLALATMQLGSVLGHCLNRTTRGPEVVAAPVHAEEDAA
ncbi:hypothetical protein [Halomonas denitrificans]|nr:hypothetical protein [Halomonas denitrificans]